MKRLFLLAGLGVLLIYGNCAKDAPTPNPSLPDLTTSGNNTMGCYADNELWVNTGQIVQGLSAPPNLDYFFHYFKKSKKTQIEIHGYMYTPAKKDYFSLAFECDEFPQKGKYYDFNLPEVKKIELRYTPNSLSLNDVFQSPKTANPATIIFTKVDTTNRIISGVFTGIVFTGVAYPGYNQGPIKSKEITKGRFDVQTKPYIIDN